MGEYADDAIDRDFNNTYGGHDWHRDYDEYQSHTIRRKEGGFCPRCTGILVERINTFTSKAFLGCSKFPKCKYSI